MERCASFLDYLHDLAVDLLLEPTKNSKTLENRFKKDFARHLRERHRIVHAHERPSWVSRFLSINSEEMKQPEVQKNIVEMVGGLFKTSSPLSRFTSDAKDLEEIIKRINDFRLNAVDQECMKMWQIFSECLNTAFDTKNLIYSPPIGKDGDAR